MVKQRLRSFFIFTVLIAVTQSGLVRRHAPTGSSSGEEEADQDTGYGWNHDIRDETDDSRSGSNPERILPDSNRLDENPELDEYDSRGIRDNEIDETTDDGLPGPFDAEEDLEGGLGNPEVPEDVDESLGDGDLDDQVDDEKGNGFDEDYGGFSGFFGGGSFFDNPFERLEQIRRYFHDLEKALGFVYKQTLDEALLLNGTFANTTKEEVDINGKKYIVQKSIIRGRDNRSSIYIETLSSKRKEEVDQDTNGMEIRNETSKDNSTSL